MKIAKQQACASEQKLRRKNLTKYVPNAAASQYFKVLQTMSETPCGAPRAQQPCINCTGHALWMRRNCSEGEHSQAGSGTLASRLLTAGMSDQVWCNASSFA